MSVQVKVSFLLDTSLARKVLFLSLSPLTANLTTRSKGACLLTYLVIEILLAACEENQF